MVGERIAELNRRIDGEAQTRPGDLAAGSSGKTSLWSRMAGRRGHGRPDHRQQAEVSPAGPDQGDTFLSMFAFFGVYWSVYGWPLAFGLGCRSTSTRWATWRCCDGSASSGGAAFIPGVGALVMLKQHVTDPVVDAKIGLAGPVWGLGPRGVAGAYSVTDAGIWLAIAHLTGFFNLFNLIPVWQLDGSRGFHALVARSGGSSSGRSGGVDADRAAATDPGRGGGGVAGAVERTGARRPARTGDLPAAGRRALADRPRRLLKIGGPLT